VQDKVKDMVGSQSSVKEDLKDTANQAYYKSKDMASYAKNVYEKARNQGGNITQ